MTEIKKCPIRVTLDNTGIGRKWTLLLIRNILFGQNTFSAMMSTNPGLSSKVLNSKLREMVEIGLIEKHGIRKDVYYELTPMGMDLNRVLYELSIFGSRYFPKEVFGEMIDVEQVRLLFHRSFKLPQNEIESLRSPEISS